MPKANRDELLARPCPKCEAGPGARCHNAKGRPCRMHKERKPRHVPNVQPVEEIRGRVEKRNEIRTAALMAYMEAVSRCGHYEGARYGRWRLKDRTGAQADRLVFVVMRPGVSGWRDRQGRTIEEIDSDGERLGPPFEAYYRQLPGDTQPGGFGFRWMRNFESIEVPAVASAEKLHAAAQKRRDKELARQKAEAERLAEWKRQNVPASLFDTNTEVDR